MNKYFNLMMVSLMVIDIKKEGYSCNLEVTLEFNDKPETTILEDVFITGLAKHRFADVQNKKFVIGHKYTAVNNSKDYDSCPIRLTRTCSQKTGKLMFILNVLNEGEADPMEYVTPKGKVIKGYKFNTIHQNNWLRYSDFYEGSLKKFKDSLKEPVDA